MSVPQRRIFLSHSHLDNEFGTRLAQDLRRAMQDESAVWYDVLGSLSGGDNWWEKIVEELTARPIFMVILSPDAVQSPWVRDEINLAWKQRNSKAGKKIIPLLYRECKVREDLDTLQVISFLSPRTYESSFNEILRALGISIQQVTPAPKTPAQPEDVGRGLVGRMEAAFADQDWPDVIRKAEYIIKRVPGAVSATVYRLQGLALLEEGEVQQAQEALESALALVSDRQQRLTLLGDYTALLARQEQWTKVLQRAKEALRLVPNDPGWLAIQQQAQDKVAKPAVVPVSVPKAQKKTKGEWVDESKALIDSNRYEESLAAAEEAIRLDPNYAMAYNNKGAALNALKRYQEASNACEQALRLDPNLTFAHLNKGIALRGLNRLQEALAVYEQGLRLAPNYGALYHGKASVLHDLKRYEEALAAYEQGLRLDPSYGGTYRDMGATLYALKRYEEALAAYEQALRLDPNNAFAYNGKGNVYYDLKRYEEALAAYEQALRLDPNNAFAYNGKGLSLEQLGRKREAQEAREKARSLGYSP